MKKLPLLSLLPLALGALTAASPASAPELAPGTWLGSAPLSIVELRGQVVLVEFWTYLCGNCRNVEPHVRAWHDRFASSGLVVIGVHTPELEVERDLEHVKRYLAEHRITWPVLVDNELRTWRAFDNRYWPAWYLIDKQGRIRHQHVGEGGYEETEAWIERLLAEPPGGPASAPSPVAAADRAYASVLEAVVDEHGLVDYAALGSPALREGLARAVQLYGDVEWPEQRDARIALGCNAYNSNLLELVRAAREAEPRLTAVTEIEGMFSARTIRVAGASLTLDALERERLRPTGDPRIHAALVCGARSCPPLRREPYDSAHLDEQLDDQCRAWINDATKNRVRDGALSLSAIFDWFEHDFAVEPYGDRLGFVKRYARRDGAVATFLAAHPEPQCVFEPYDWRFNDARREPAQRPSS